MAEVDAHAGRRDAILRLFQLGGLSAGLAGGGLWLRYHGQAPLREPALAERYDFTVPDNATLPLAVARGDDPASLLRRAVDSLGGIRRFISRGDVVAIKPNMAWDRAPEQAANTNPQVVAEMVRLCREAGARSVMVSDVSIHDARLVFARSGIAAAARAAGATIILPAPRHFREMNLQGEVLGVWPVFTPLVQADKVINMPVAKQHSLTGVSLGIKNWYGLLGGPRRQLHQRIHECLADLAAFVRPTLTVLDAWRVLLRNGPTGGNLEDVTPAHTLIAGVDPVAVDAWAARAWWNLDASQLPYLKLAAARGLGTADPEKLRISFS
ncbi:MAG TPA: DUF362 domain-containing protein [Bryobacteraceae bacterium]|nr:DUF362 domain-containing protein [Bryobacteraceae bacterium]